MGSKNKLKRFKENETFANVIQPSREVLLEKNFDLKGNWKKDFFKNDHPLVLELGCGKGEYSVNLAKEFPQKNFLGIDIKGARFWRGAKTALEEGLKNVGFLRTQIELIEHCFAENEVDEIWITFPDPQIKYKRTKHRLTNEEFLDKYRKVIRPKGVIHLKTDSEFMHGY
ncbi:MAG TPA: tRNA (guanosine(46)-N7)-methyltransferase TrmB, partial [Flavobacteriaceae bacterium]|nr:tRNA (guanosine(46)-N7)-methyltransferase TrmB [Flavobacteriaceae bacterium]